MELSDYTQNMRAGCRQAVCDHILQLSDSNGESSRSQGQPAITSFHATPSGPSAVRVTHVYHPLFIRHLQYSNLPNIALKRSAATASFLEPTLNHPLSTMANALLNKCVASPRSMFKVPQSFVARNWHRVTHGMRCGTSRRICLVMSCMHLGLPSRFRAFHLLLYSAYVIQVCNVCRTHLASSVAAGVPTMCCTSSAVAQGDSRSGAVLFAVPYIAVHMLVRMPSGAGVPRR